MNDQIDNDSPINFTVPSELKIAMRVIAASRDRSIADECRIALQEYIARNAGGLADVAKTIGKKAQ